MDKFLNLLVWGPQRDALITDILTNRENYHLEKPVCLLFKNQAQIKDFQYRHLSGAENNSPLTWIAKTYFQFYEDLAEQLNLPVRLLSSTAKMLLMAQIAGEKQEQWQYLAGEQREPSLTALADFAHLLDMLDLQFGESWAKTLDENPQQPDITARFLSDLTRLNEAYHQRKNNALVELTLFFREVAKSLPEEGLQRAVNNARTVVWMDAADLNPLLFLLLGKMRSSHIKTVGMLEYFPHPPVFLHKQALYENLVTHSEEVKEVTGARLCPDRFFEAKEMPKAEAPKICLFRFPDAVREMEYVAGRIKKMIVEENLPPHQVAVALPNPGKYLNLVETVFSRHGIPFVNQIPAKLSASRVIQQLLLPVRLVESNYDVDILKQILLSPYYNFKKELSAPLVNQLVRQIRVQFGLSDIDAQLRRLEGTGSAFEEESQPNEMKQAASLCRKALELSGFFESGHSPLEVLGYFKKLVQDHLFLNNEILHHREEDYSALQKFFSMMEDWVRVNQNMDKLPPAAIFLVLRQIVRSGSYRVRRPANWAVRLVSPAQLVDAPAQQVFLPGADEDAFRDNSRRGQLVATAMPEEWRGLVSVGAESAEKEHFLQILNLPYQRLLISYPAFQGETPQLPSPFLRELQRVTGLKMESPEVEPLPTLGDISAELIRADGESVLAELPEWFRGLVHLPTLARLQRQFKNLQTRYWAHFPPGLWEGNLKKDRISALWMKEVASRAVFSVSRLEEYIVCPMKYFLHYLLGVSGEEAIELEISALERGNFLHDLLFRFFTEYSESERSYEKLAKLAKKMSSGLPLPEGLFKNAFLTELLGDKDKPGLLELFWEAEEAAAAGSQSDWRPGHFELSFGMKDGGDASDAASVEAPFVFSRNGRTYQLRGRIDRVDLAPDGKMAVMDYKTGQPPTLEEVKEGKKLQLPVYLIVAAELLQNRSPAPVPVAAAYYQLRDPIKRKWMLADLDRFDPGPRYSGLKFFANTEEGEAPQLLEDFLEVTLGRVAEVIDQIGTADFRHTTDSRACGSGEHACRFQTLCRLVKSKQKALAEKEENSSPPLS